MLRFKEQGTGGVILNTGSVAGLVGWGGAVYGATKGGVHLLDQGSGYRGGAVRHPGERHLPGRHAVHRLHGGRRHGRCPEAMQQIGEQVGASHPLGRPITAEDCAEAAVFLCSDEAVNITGVLLPVDGGYVAR